MRIPAWLVFTGLSGVAATQAQTWIQTSAPITNWSAVASSADGTRLAAAASGMEGGFIFVSTNSGVDWTQTSAPNTNWGALASSADGQRLVATTWGGESIWTTTNGALTWTEDSVKPYGIGLVAAVASSADGAKLVASGSSYIYTSPDAGLTWTTTSPRNYGWNPASTVTSSADGITLAAVAEGTGLVFQFYFSTNAGASWTQIDGPPNSNTQTRMAASADGQKLVVALNLIGISTSTNLGQTWEASDAAGDIGWGAVSCSADASKMAAIGTLPTGPLGWIYRSTDSGATWVQTDAPATNWSALASSADGNKLVALVHNGGIYTWQAPALPQLNIAPAQGNVLLFWNASSGAILQQNTTLGTSNWTAVATTPILTNGQFQLLAPLTNGSRFYRLKNG